MKKVSTIDILIALMIFLIGIFFNSTLFFLIGFFSYMILMLYDFDCFLKKM